METPERGLAVVTPSYADDIELFRDLHRSVLTYTPADVIHHVIVPRQDRALFAPLAGPRCRIWAEQDLLPRQFVSVPRLQQVLRRIPRLPPGARVVAVNRRRPFPLVRGWILQQALKLEMATRVDADLMLLVDSDVLLVAPLDTDRLRPGGRVRFYRQENAVFDGAMTHHMRWHDSARRLLGLPPGAPPLPDYVSSFTVWEPQVVKGLLHRVEEVAGRAWQDVLTSQIQLSEWTLYGVYVDEVLGPDAAVCRTDRTLCHSYWDTVPLSLEMGRKFLDRRHKDDVAVLIQSKSRTPIEIRRQLLPIGP